MKNKRILSTIWSYNVVVEGWWIAARCKNLAVTNFKNFKIKVGATTQLMQKLLTAEFGLEADPKMRYTEWVQMYSLNETSAEKFYGCGSEALVEVRKTAYLADEFTKGLKLIPTK